jgi:hypothetical protein
MNLRVPYKAWNFLSTGASQGGSASWSCRKLCMERVKARNFLRSFCTQTFYFEWYECENRSHILLLSFNCGRAHRWLVLQKSPGQWSGLSPLWGSCARSLLGPLADVERYFMFCYVLFINRECKYCSLLVHNVWIRFSWSLPTPSFHLMTFFTSFSYEADIRILKP